MEVGQDCQVMQMIIAGPAGLVEVVGCSAVETSKPLEASLNRSRVHALQPHRSEGLHLQFPGL